MKHERLQEFAVIFMLIFLWLLPAIEIFSWNFISEQLQLTIIHNHKVMIDLVFWMNSCLALFVLLRAHQIWKSIVHAHVQFIVGLGIVLGYLYLLLNLLVIYIIRFSDLGMAQS